MMTYCCNIFALLLCLTLCVCSSTTGRAQTASPAPGAGKGQLPPYIIVVGDDYDPSVYHLEDSVFNEIAGRVIFKVNRTNLNENSPFIRELRDSVLPMANANEWMLMGMDLRGAASPEGPYWNNVRLSKGRAAALRNFLEKHLDYVSDQAVVTTTVAEDYAYLLWLLQQDDDPAAPTVEKIIEECGADNEQAIKARLRKVDGGRLWRRLLKEYYPGVRYARLVMFMKPVHPPREPYVINPPVMYLEEIRMPELVGGMPHLNIPLPFPLQRVHVVSLGTNVLYDGFYMPQYGWAPMPNLQLEFYPRRGNFTFQCAFMWPYYHRWSHHKFFQIRDYHLEARRYFNPGDHHTGAYLGAYVNASKYGIGFNRTKGWEGEGLGAALKAGYVVGLGQSRWRIDFHIAAGGYYTRFDPYQYGNPITGEEDGDYYYDWTLGASSFKKRNHKLSWLGPTEIGVTITYDIIMRMK